MPLEHAFIFELAGSRTARISLSFQYTSHPTCKLATSPLISMTTVTCIGRTAYYYRRTTVSTTARSLCRPTRRLLISTSCIPCGRLPKTQCGSSHSVSWQNSRPIDIQCYYTSSLPSTQLSPRNGHRHGAL